MPEPALLPSPAGAVTLNGSMDTSGSMDGASTAGTMLGSAVAYTRGVVFALLLKNILVERSGEHRPDSEGQVYLNFLKKRGRESRSQMCGFVVKT